MDILFTFTAKLFKRRKELFEKISEEEEDGSVVSLRDMNQVLHHIRKAEINQDMEMMQISQGFSGPGNLISFTGA